MIKYPPTKITVGNAYLRISCQLNKMGGQTDYYVGDRLTGSLTLQTHTPLNISHIEVRLEYILKGPYQSSKRNYSGVLVCQELTLQLGKKHQVPFSLPVTFPWANNFSASIKGFWRMKISIYPKRTKSDLLKSSRKMRSKTRSVDLTFQVPVINGDGQFRVLPKRLPIQHFETKKFLFILLFIGFFFYLAWASNTALSLKTIQLFLVGLTLPIITLLYLRLYRFKDIPMELTENGDGKLKVRMLDRGDGHWKKMTLGYQVVAKYIEKTGKNTVITRQVLYKREFLLQDIGRPSEHFIEAPLPWPKWSNLDLLVSYQHDQQGYTWEIYLKTPGLLQEQVQTWPIAVSWEAFRLPGTTHPEEMLEEPLELHPIKEEVRLKNKEQR